MPRMRKKSAKTRAREMANKRANESNEERSRRLAAERERRSRSRALETEEDRAVRLARARARQSTARAHKKAMRLRLAKTQLRQLIEEERAAHLAQVRAQQSRSRAQKRAMRLSQIPFITYIALSRMHSSSDLLGPGFGYDQIEKIQAESAPSAMQYEPESILPDIPDMSNSDTVKKELIDDTYKILSSTSQNIPAIRNASSFTLSVKSEPFEDIVDDMTIPVNPNDIIPLSASYDSGENSEMSTLYTDSTEPPLKKPNLSPSPSSNSIEIKDEFSVFGNFVTTKIRSFSDRLVQIEAQHYITNMLLEIEKKDLNEDSLSTPVPFSSNVNKNSGCHKQLPAIVMRPSCSSISKISNFQMQIPATAALSST